jgi:hypothetical protein
MSEVFAMFLGGLLCLLGWLLTGIAGFRSERPEIVWLFFAGGFVCWGLLFLGILGWAALLHLMVEGVAI